MELRGKGIIRLKVVSELLFWKWVYKNGGEEDKIYDGGDIVAVFLVRQLILVLFFR